MGVLGVTVVCGCQKNTGTRGGRKCHCPFVNRPIVTSDASCVRATEEFRQLVKRCLFRNSRMELLLAEWGWSNRDLEEVLRAQFNERLDDLVVACPVSDVRQPSHHENCYERKESTEYDQLGPHLRETAWESVKRRHGVCAFHVRGGRRVRRYSGVGEIRQWSVFRGSEKVVNAIHGRDKVFRPFRALAVLMG